MAAKRWATTLRTSVRNGGDHAVAASHSISREARPKVPVAAVQAEPK